MNKTQTWIIIICIVALGTGSYMMYNAITEQQYAEQQVNADKQALKEITDDSGHGNRQYDMNQCLKSVKNGTEPIGFKELDYCDKKIG